MSRAPASPNGPSGTPRPHRWLGLVPMVLLVATGLYALDFGPHWDEDGAWLAPLRRSFEVGAPLPGKYNYPSFGYWLTLFATLPEVIGAKLQGVDISDHVLATIHEQPFRMRLRAIFLVVSSLGVLWTYRLVLRWRGSAAEALLAACLLAFSFEVSYHVRWVAPDGLLMQFAALTMLCCMAAVAPGGGRRWLWAAAVAAGLGCGSKYPGGLLMAPVFVAYCAAAAPELRARRWLPALGLGLGLLLAFAATFLATTPGALLEAEAFDRDLDYELVHYREGGHGVYTVQKGLPHLGMMLVYFGSQVLSPFDHIAWALAALAALGVVVTLRERPLVALLLLVFPVLYVGYMSSMVVLAVRNVLVIAPFLAIFAARGIGFLVAHSPARAARGALVGGALALVVGHAAYTLQAAERTRHRSLDRSLTELAAHVRRMDDAVFALSPEVRAGLAAKDLDSRLPAVTEMGDPRATHLAILPAECAAAYDRWVIGKADLVTFGPREINFLYYPTAWNHQQRILVMPVATARRMGLVP